MPQIRKRLLLVVHTNSYFTGLLPLAKSLLSSGIFEPLILFARAYPTLPVDLDSCRMNGIPMIFGRITGREMENKRREALAKSAPGRIRNRRLEKYIRMIKSPPTLMNFILTRLFSGSLAWELLSLLKVISEVRAIIRREQVSLLVLPADNRYDQAAYIRAAHMESVGAVVVPQFMASQLEWAEYVWDQSNFQAGRMINWIAGKLYPHWVYLYKGRWLVALPGAQIFARQWLNLSPPLPWILHSGHADALALESEAMRKYCRAEGLPLEQMHVTGSVSLDAMFESLADIQNRKDALCRSLRLSKDRPIILSALPPDTLYMGRPECDFQEYTKLVEFWCRSISSVNGYHHIVALHPSVRYEEMRHIEAYGLKVAHIPTMDLVPLCDIFVASISSTIQWAIACGKPVLNYDVFRYRYTDYRDVAGVITVEEQTEFLDLLAKLTSDAGFLASVIARQAIFAEEWGCLDGIAGERLQNLFQSVIDRYDV
jgi:hypothetical protein